MPTKDVSSFYFYCVLWYDGSITTVCCQWNTKKMKIYLSKYRNHWLSPYTILEKVFFWREIDYDEPIIKKLSDRLTPLCIAWMKFLDFVHPQIEFVKIDKYDTWNMDSTLSKIILPMLKQLQATTNGAQFVDNEDVPEELKSTNAPAKETEWDIDDNYFKRWDYVIGEMIWAFEQKNSDWDEQYQSGEHDIGWEKDEKTGMAKLKLGSNDTYEIDMEGMKLHQVRITNGFRLFGKYFEGLWD